MLYLRLPVLLERNNTTYAIEVPFNPAHIVAIEPDTEDKSCCYVVTVKDDYYIPLTCEQVEKKINTFVKQSILRQYYNDTKNNNC